MERPHPNALPERHFLIVKGTQRDAAARCVAKNFTFITEPWPLRFHEGAGVYVLAEPSVVEAWFDHSDPSQPGSLLYFARR